MAGRSPAVVISGSKANSRRYVYDATRTGNVADGNLALLYEYDVPPNG